MSERLETVITGSFKLKPEIDALHEEFADHDVLVLEPTKGWLYRPGLLPSQLPAFRPLPSELGLSPGAIEDRFLRALDKADFLYLYNPESYVGSSSALELGYAIGSLKPLFAKEPIELENVEYDLERYFFLRALVNVATPAEAVQAVRDDAYTRYRRIGRSELMRIGIENLDPRTLLPKIE